jgi:hypothetical protein
MGSGASRAKGTSLASTKPGGAPELAVVGDTATQGGLKGPWENIQRDGTLGIRSIQTSLLEAREILRAQRESLEDAVAEPATAADIIRTEGISRVPTSEQSAPRVLRDYRVLVPSPVLEEPWHRSVSAGTIDGGGFVFESHLTHDALGGEWVYCARYTKPSGWVALLAADGHTLQLVQDFNGAARRSNRRFKKYVRMIIAENRIQARKAVEAENMQAEVVQRGQEPEAEKVGHRAS